jgi:hypothetical protein
MFFHRIEMRKDLIVPKAQNLKTCSLQKFCPFFVVFGIGCMLSAINFNYRPLFETDKIEDVVFERVLPSKFAARLSVAQYVPETALCIGHIFSQGVLPLVVENCGTCLTLHNPSPP